MLCLQADTPIVQTMRLQADARLRRGCACSPIITDAPAESPQNIPCGTPAPRRSTDETCLPASASGTSHSPAPPLPYSQPSRKTAAETSYGFRHTGEMESRWTAYKMSLPYGRTARLCPHYAASCDISVPPCGNRVLRGYRLSHRRLSDRSLQPDRFSSDPFPENDLYSANPALFVQ